MEQQVYFGNWGCLEDLVSDFEQLYSWRDGDETPAEHIEKHDTYKINVLFAAYTYESYSGDAYVLFEKDGQLFEVHGSHCSCHGLEGQWSPEETTKEYILGELDRQEASNYSYGVMFAWRDELRKALERV